MYNAVYEQVSTKMLFFFSPPVRADIDECADGKGPCQQICKNTEGGYECSCNDGFVISPLDPNLCEGRI